MPKLIDDQNGIPDSMVPDLPAPTKRVILGSDDKESGKVKAPLSDGSPVSPPSVTKQKILLPIKRLVTIMERDNGYDMTLDAGNEFRKELVFNSMKSMIKTLMVFLTSNISQEVVDIPQQGEGL